MISNFNILFTSAGRRVSLVREFKRALKDLSLEGNIIAADTKNTASAAFVADRAVQVPLCDEPRYIDILKNICIQNQVNLLIPLIDPE